MKKIIIVTSRKYFAKANGAVSVAGSEFADLFRNEYLSSVELELILEGVPAGETGLLKLQVISDYTRN